MSLVRTNIPRQAKNELLIVDGGWAWSALALVAKNVCPWLLRPSLQGQGRVHFCAQRRQERPFWVTCPRLGARKGPASGLQDLIKGSPCADALPKRHKKKLHNGDHKMLKPVSQHMVQLPISNCHLKNRKMLTIRLRWIYEGRISREWCHEPTTRG